MKRIEQSATLVPDYGKRKLLTYAESFRDLAKIFLYLPKEDDIRVEMDRQDYLLQKRLTENRGLLADHLNEMAQIMTRVAEESFYIVKPSEKQMKQLYINLKKNGVLLKDVAIIENKDRRMEITLNLKSGKKSNFSIEEISGVLSVVFNKRFLPTIGSTTYLGKEFQTVVFEEESKYGILTGIARAIKEKERISGDNYSFLQMTNGKLTVALSDGMGAGEKACKDSCEVIDLLEKLLEAGFGKETAVQIINGVLIAGSEEQNMSTLDICDVDLYAGNCEFIKVGSSITFIKKDHMVEEISATTLPLGVFSHIDVEVMKQKVSDGTYIIMLSDGIIDSIPLDENAEIFRRMISKIEMQNPKEIANHILNFSLHAGQGVIKDDMTVLVIGIWENDLQI